MESKSFFKDTFITIFANAGRLLVGLVISIVLARGLGPSNKGIYSLALLFPTLIMTFVNLGIGPATVYYTAQKKYSPPEILGSNVLIGLILSGIGIIIGYLVIRFFGSRLFPQVEVTYLVVSLLYIPASLFIQQTGSQILLGMRLIKKFNAIILGLELLFLPLLLAFLFVLNFGVLGAILAKVISAIVICVLLLFWARMAAGGISFRINRKYIKDLFSYGSKAYIGNIIGFLNYRIEIFILGILMPASEIGFYSVAVSLAEKLWILSRSAATVLFPVISAEKDEEKRKAFTPFISRTVLLVTAILAAILAVSSRWIIVLLYSNTYLPTVELFRVLLPGVVLMSASRVLANDIAGRGKPLLNSIVGFLGLIVQVIMNLFLIPRFAALGAAITITVTYTLTFLLRIVIYTRVSGNSFIEVLLPKYSDLLTYCQSALKAIKLVKTKVLSRKK